MLHAADAIACRLVVVTARNNFVASKHVISYAHVSGAYISTHYCLHMLHTLLFVHAITTAVTVQTHSTCLCIVPYRVHEHALHTISNASYK
jgi:hypothetical protein